jgi:acetyl-CoA carboxylase carboxyl transferase subunit beta
VTETPFPYVATFPGGAQVRDFLRRHPKNFTIADAAQARQRDVPENMWVKCPRCNDLLYNKEFERNLKVCQKCGYHFRLNATERLALLLDPDTFEERDAGLEPSDPLVFVSEGESYEAKLHKTQAKTGRREAVIYGTGQVEGAPLVVAVCDFDFLGASMGSVFGEKIARAAGLAVDRRLPLLTVSASGGARMHEGIFSLMQMAKTTAALVGLGEARLPYISLLTDPCFGGVTASYASVADVILAEPGALIGFAGPRVIEQTIRQKLPAGFQTAEFLLQHGMVDQVTPRRELRPTLARLFHLYESR